MLTHRHATTMLPVTDVQRARRFYEEKLGLSPGTPQPGGEIRYETDGSTLALYPRAAPPKSDHTAVSFEVEDIEREVRDLRGRGVRFEHYDMPDAREHDDIYELAGPGKCAWMKDPDGNILCIHEVH
jgi:catechol 2,3-dioxygenase-like lactoylglutathione lyase family enzyme